MRNTLAIALLLAAGLMPLASQAESGHDHDRARAALQAGEILPLPVVLERVAKEHPGNVLEVDLEREKNRWVYELKILQSGGGLLKLEVDAKDASVIKRREEKR
ncbi:MAG: PepSY domain-containing protein [Hylemonella sp.]|nr:PepSY domain-containing protein [Hylemonella sp.]MDP1936628.1 PepSY domain-containing protein [Hylemonella sp.]